MDKQLYNMRPTTAGSRPNTGPGLRPDTGLGIGPDTGFDTGRTTDGRPTLPASAVVVVVLILLITAALALAGLSATVAAETIGSTGLIAAEIVRRLFIATRAGAR